MSYVTYPNNPFPPSSENTGGGGGQYVLPVASDETLGGIKVGSNLTIGEDGELSAPTPYIPINYSTTEQNTGKKWIDGSDIYTCTWDFEQDVSISGASYTDTTIDASGISKVIDYEALQSNGTNKSFNISCDSTYIKMCAMSGSSETIRYLTLYYVKTSV